MCIFTNLFYQTNVHMIIIELIFNLAILIAVSVLSGFIEARWKRKTIQGAVLQGLLFGGTAIIGMLNPFVLSSGIFLTAGV